MDIGEFLAKQEILNDISRKNLLGNLFQPEEGFTFPTKWLHGCFRSFNFKLWTKQYPFLVYSRSMDSAFCLSCVLFATSLTSLFNKSPGFSNWHKTGEKTEEHNNTSAHKESMSKLEDFEARFSNPDLTIPFSFDKERQQRIENNTEILRWVIEVIITCGKQCLPLRAHRENTPDANSGNILAILRLLGKTNETLKEHLDNPIARNAQYLSPQIQNKIISIIAYDTLQKDLIDEVKKAKFFTILADEVEGHHVEQLPICVRFVDKSNDIREEFLEFGRCTQVNGEAISNEILRIIKKSDLDIMNCRGQGYNGASNMSSEAVIYLYLYHSIRAGV